MKAAALLLLGGCAQIFGLSSPHAGDASVVVDSSSDALDAHIDIADAAPGHCVTISDCPTSVCLPSTLCAADTDVAWLDPTGSGNTMCTMAMPCTTLNNALNTNRPYIRVHGAISSLSSISRDVSIFAEPGGAFTNANLLVNSGNIGLYDLEFATSCLQLQGGTTTAEHIYVHNCLGVGINANGVLILDGSTVTQNRSGGIVIQSSPFTITNNFIFENGMGGGGGGGANAGGIAIQSSVTTGSRLDFNTVAANAVKTGTTVAGGVYCNTPGFTGVGNVISGNLGGGSTMATYANKNGACDYSASVIQTNLNLGFVDAPTGNFHITAASTLRDAATVQGPRTDVDGESRPYGSADDIGADEYHP